MTNDNAFISNIDTSSNEEGQPIYLSALTLDTKVFAEIHNDQDKRSIALAERRKLIDTLIQTDEYEGAWLNHDLGTLRKSSPSIYYSILPTCLHTDYTRKLIQEGNGWVKHVKLHYDNFSNVWTLSIPRLKFTIEFKGER